MVLYNNIQRWAEDYDYSKPYRKPDDRVKDDDHTFPQWALPRD